jgi:hypothetical protein
MQLISTDLNNRRDVFAVIMTCSFSAALLANLLTHPSRELAVFWYATSRQERAHTGFNLEGNVLYMCGMQRQTGISISSVRQC